jgi:hypothetical protein
MRVGVMFETGEQDARLEVPWRSADQTTEYLDLRADPGAIREIAPARRHRPLYNFLVMLNSGDSVFSTAYCKVWLEPERGETSEFASLVDLFFAPEDLNQQRGHYEGLCEQLLELLTHDSGDTLHAELRVRRCHFRESGAAGYCLAVVLRARGETPGQAELRWGLGLARVQQALLFVSRGIRHWLAQTG